ncbi:hypothetical protein GCM10022280_21020 [Sphingomonas swuensis]|uniref:Uncharacterized protein n=1 Tax=Sphingomonas swuensis TaxID=977800 RepID=A0ABP7T3S1_9SPHN
MTIFTTDQWVIIGLVFVLGLLIGMWLTSGGRRKWKNRYNDEVTTRKALEDKHKEREAHWTAQEKDWRDQDARREAALRDRPAMRSEPYVEDRLRDRHPDDIGGERRDLDRDGVPDNYDRRPLDGDRR